MLPKHTPPKEKKKRGKYKNTISVHPNAISHSLLVATNPYQEDLLVQIRKTTQYYCMTSLYFSFPEIHLNLTQTTMLGENFISDMIKGLQHHPICPSRSICYSATKKGIKQG